jgi:glutathione S-transferase
MGLQLWVGNKNYSSWSMRAGVLMRALGIPFDERRVRLDLADASAFRALLSPVTPAGRVPVLVLDDGWTVWDTLAITETLHERFPDRGVWPADARSRARARSICAEMHAGFAALRTHCPMNIEADLAAAGATVWATQPEVRADVERVETMWADALGASGGPFLFGAAFCAADAFYAPVAMRLRGYALPVSEASAAYVRRLEAVPAVAAWMADARAEHDFIVEDEPYRTGPSASL